MSFIDQRGLDPKGPVQAFLLSIVGAAAFTALGSLVILIAGTGFIDVVLALLTLAFSFVVAMIIIGISAAITGLPLTWALSRSRLEQPWVYPVAGFIIGALIVVSPRLLEARWDGLLQALPYTLIGALPGSICGAIWWFAHRRHQQRPDADAGIFD